MLGAIPCTVPEDPEVSRGSPRFVILRLDRILVALLVGEHALSLSRSAGFFHDAATAVQGSHAWGGGEHRGPLPCGLAGMNDGYWSCIIPASVHHPVCVFYPSVRPTGPRAAHRAPIGRY